MLLNENTGQSGADTGTRVPPRGASNVVREPAVLPALRRKRRQARRHLLLLLLAVALIISTVLSAAEVQKVGTTLTVQVTHQPAASIDLVQSFPISPYLLGSNAFPLAGTTARDPAGRGFMSYAPQIVRGLRSAGIKLLRFPGGNWGEEHTLSTAQINDFSSLLNQVGAEGYMQAQLSDPLDKVPVSLAVRASRAALLVDYMNHRQSIQRTGANAHAPYHPVKYWCIGNEPDLLINPETGQTYTVNEYTQAFIAYSLAMHKQDPSIQVFGPELSQYSVSGGPKDRLGTPWMEGFLRGVGAYERTHKLPFQLLNGVSFHLYPFGEGQDNIQTLLSNPQEWNALVPSLHQLILQTVGEDLPIAVTEINTNPGNVPPPQNMAALWWAETLGALMNNQVGYVAFFSTEGVASPYPLFSQPGLSGTAMLSTMQLFARLQRNLVPVQGTQSPVSIYATQNGGHTTVSLLFINQANTSQEVRVQGEGFLNPWQSAMLTLPGYGMAVLTLHRGSKDETLRFDNQSGE